VSNSGFFASRYSGGRLHGYRLRGHYLLTALAGLWLLAGCAPGERARDEGMSLLSDAKYEEGLGMLAEAVRLNPGSAQLRKDYLFQRGLIVDRLLADAAAQRRVNRLDAAEVLYRRIFGVDPTNVAARQGLAEIEAERRHGRLLDEAEALAKKGDAAGARALLSVVMLEHPNHPRAAKIRYQLEEPTLKENLAGPTLNIKGRKPLTLQFRDANLKMVLEAIARTTGVNILLDKEVKNDIKVTIFVRDSSVEETLDLLLIQNQLEKRVLGENTVLIYAATPAKNKDYQDLKVRRFSLGNADPKQVQTMLKTIIKTKDIFVDEKGSAVVIRDTPEAVRLAERLVTAMDQPEPEVMLEIDVLQVDRNRLLSLGIDWSKSVTWTLPPNLTLLELKNTKPTVSGLSATLNASKTDGDVNDLATPRIRVRNKEKAKILIGTRNPVVSSAATPVTGGTSTSASQAVYNTSIQYIETGVKVEVEPHIHPDGDVAIKLNLEVSSAGAQIDTGTSGTVVFPVNTNNVTTLLQLKDGETQILGGLLQQQSDQSQTKIPGAGDVPLLGRLFGTVKDTWNKKELIFAITPHVVRNVTTREADLVELWSGTEGRLRFGAPSLKVAASGGLVGQTSAGGGGATPSPSSAGVPVGRPPVAMQPPPPPPPSQSAPVAPVAAPLTASLVGPGQAKPGDRFSVSLGVYGGPALASVSAALRYDSAVLRAVSVSEGNLLKKNNAQGKFDGQIDEGGGAVSIELAAEEGGGAPGGGGLATITFEVVGSGTATVTVTSLSAAAVGGGSVPAAEAAPLQVSVP
jgi:general secretion pathway protein D